MSITHIIIRADTSARIGSGHVMRCLALAQAWQDAGGCVTFVMAITNAALENRLKSEGMIVSNISVNPGSADDATRTVDLAHEVQASWMVVDGYHFSADYQRIIKESGLNILFVDDYGHADHYYADIVLNQNIYAHEGLYVDREAYTQLLLGTPYILLRREFTRWRNWERSFPKIGRKVLVTLGGADPDNATLVVIRALENVAIENLEVIVVIGANNPYDAELRSAANRSSLSIRLQKNVMNMPELMAWADIAIVGGGTTCWELAFMGLPGLTLVLADNQQPIAEWLDTKKVAIHLNGIQLNGQGKLSEKIQQAFGQINDAEIRAQMSQQGRSLVDGRGCERVLQRLKIFDLKLRPVHQSDCKLLWEWANEPIVRKVSFVSDLIPWEQHVEWFNQKTSDPNCLIYIASNTQDIPIGQARFDIDNKAAIISVSMDQQFRGQGFGSALIKRACQEIFASSDVDTIHAYIKLGNEGSVRAFEKAGFERLANMEVKGSETLHLILSGEVA